MKFNLTRTSNLCFILLLILSGICSKIKKFDVGGFKSQNNKNNFTSSEITEISKDANATSRLSEYKESNPKKNSNPSPFRSQAIHKLEPAPTIRKNLLKNFPSEKRILTLTVSRSNECSVFVTDKVTYKKINLKSDFILHYIITSEKSPINVISVTSDEIENVKYSFNHTRNTFLIYFDSIDKNLKNFSILYQYEAKNFIKSVGNPVRESFQNRDTFLFNGDSLNPSTKISTNFSSTVYNLFVWKILNRSLEFIEIEFILIFDLGRDFAKYDIFSRNQKFNLNKNKTVLFEKDKTLVKYEWTHEISAFNSVVVDFSFPMYFENCKYEKINLFSVIFGSIFIIALTFMLYFLFASFCHEELM